MSAGERGPNNLVLALAAALVAALAVAGWQVVDARTASDDLEDARTQLSSLEEQGDLAAEKAASQAALESAQKILLEITTYSWKEGDHEFAWLDQIAGTELKEQLAPNVPDLQRAIEKGKVTAQGTVIDSAARVVDATQVEVLAFVDQAITDETNKDIKIEEQRVSMTMTLVDGAWLVERLELLSGTNSQASE